MSEAVQALGLALAYLALLAALGAAPAAWLARGFPSRAALAPALGLAIAATVLVSLAQVMSMRTAAWAVVLPGAVVSLGAAAWRGRRTRGRRGAARRPGAGGDRARRGGALRAAGDDPRHQGPPVAGRLRRLGLRRGRDLAAGPSGRGGPAPGCGARRPHPGLGPHDHRRRLPDRHDGRERGDGHAAGPISGRDGPGPGRGPARRPDPRPVVDGRLPRGRTGRRRRGRGAAAGCRPRCCCWWRTPRSATWPRWSSRPRPCSSPAAAWPTGDHRATPSPPACWAPGLVALFPEFLPPTAAIAGLGGALLVLVRWRRGSLGRGPLKGLAWRAALILGITLADLPAGAGARLRPAARLQLGQRLRHRPAPALAEPRERRELGLRRDPHLRALTLGHPGQRSAHRGGAAAHRPGGDRRSTARSEAGCGGSRSCCCRSAPRSSSASRPSTATRASTASTACGRR